MSRPRPFALAPLLAVATVVSALTGAAAGGRVVDEALRYLGRATAGLPATSDLNAWGLPRTNRFYARDGVTLLDIRVQGEEDRDWTPFAALPDAFVHALVSTEDKTFWENDGTDFAAILRSALSNAAAGEVTGGGSTITQQLIKRLLLSNEQTVERKLREISIASDVAATLSKEEVLELYVNSVFYGERAYSPESAARRYFGKPLAELSLTQIAMLAGLPKAPTSFNPFVDESAARARMRVVLESMLRDGHITPAERDAAAAAPFDLVPYNSPVPVAPWFTAAAEREAIALLGEDAYRTCGCDFITTLDAALQSLAQRTLTNHLKANLPKSKAYNGALITQDVRTGDILAYVGSSDATSSDPRINGQYDAAGVARRQPGSSWKPIDYLSAIEAGGLSSASSVWDVSTEFAPALDGSPAYRPNDFAKDFGGLMTLRQALRESRNIPAVRAVLAYGGLPAMFDMARRLGIRQEMNEQNSGPAAALGTTSVTLREMTQVYATIAGLGRRVEARTLLRFEHYASDEAAWIAPDPVGEQVVRPEIAFTVVDILRDNSTSLSWVHGRRGNVGRPAIAKSGTAAEVRDTYFMGGLPQLVTGVWVGNADNSQINLGSGPGAGEIYRRYMLALIKQRGADLPVENWAAPAGMVQVKTCGNLTAYGGWGWNRPADGVEPCPFTAVDTWIIPGFNDPVSAAGADLPRYGTFAVDSRNRIVDPAVCAAARSVTGLLAIAERPEWQDDLEAWIAAGTPRGKSTRTYPWRTMAMILPGDGQCVDGDAATPSPNPTLPPASPPPAAP